MKSVVMIAYHFPPEGNAAAFRPLRFARCLPTKGWSVSVISADRYERYDAELLALIPQETEVFRVRARDPWQAIQARRTRRFQKQIAGVTVERAAQIRAAQRAPVRSFIRELVHRAESWCYQPDMAMFWIRPALKATMKACSSRQPNVIWATGGPWSSFIVAEQTSLRTGVPYVLDFRSLWTVVPNEFEMRRPTWAKRLDHRILYRLLKGAQAVIFAYDTEAECFWRVYPGALDVSRIHIIPNGYDGTIETFGAPVGQKCTILYAGTLSWYRYDTLLQALQRIKRADPSRARQLHFHFVGEATEELADEAASLGLSDLVETSAPTSHAEIARLQRQAHALLMLERKPTMPGYELLAGAKLFGYLKAGRPIVGVLPQGEAQKILHRVGVSTVADVDSSGEIVDVLQQLLDAWSAGTLSSLVPDRAACEAYSAERQTVALIRALEGVLPLENFVPCCVEIPPSLQKIIMQV
jgi:Glycosyl transferase 4-like domain